MRYKSEIWNAVLANYFQFVDIEINYVNFVLPLLSLTKILNHEDRKTRDFSNIFAIPVGLTLYSSLIAIPSISESFFWW